MHRALLELVTSLAGDEAFDDEEAVAVIGVDLLVRQHGRQATAVSDTLRGQIPASVG